MTAALEWGRPAEGDRAGLESGNQDGCSEEVDTTETTEISRQKRWRLANPHAYRAHVKVCNALRSGAIIRPDACEDCGADDRRLDAHHPSYEPGEELKVRWVCRSCHIRLHRRRAA